MDEIIDLITYSAMVGLLHALLSHPNVRETPIIIVTQRG